MSVSPITHVARVITEAVTTDTAPKPQSKPSLLPTPSALGYAGLEDGAALLLKLASDMNRRQTDVQKSDLAVASAERELHMKDVDKKFQEWLANQNNPFGWLADVFKAVGIALSAVASAMTGGALGGLMVGAIALSAASFLVEKTEMFGPEASKWIAMVTGACAAVTGGIANVAGLGQTAEKVGEEVAKTTTRQILGKIADISGTAVSAGEEALHLGDAIIRHNQGEREADVKESQNHLEQVRRMIGLLLEGLKDLNQVHRRAVETVQDTVRVSCETSAMVAAGTRV